MARQEVERRDPHVLVALLHLIELGSYGAVRRDKAIAAEVAIIGFVVEVATVGVVLLTRRAGLGKALVHPVPDTAAHVARRALKGGDILGEVADRVAHGMGVLTDKEGLAGLALALGHDVVHDGVHHAIHICHGAHALVVDGAGAIQAVGELGGGLEVHPRSRLVAQRPDHHTGVVFMGLDHALGPVEVCLLPRDIVA